MQNWPKNIRSTNKNDHCAKIQPNESYQFVFTKDELNEHSYSHMYRNSAKYRPIPKSRRIASVALFVASLLSIFLALALVGVVSAANKLSVENMWLFFLMTPIPIASIVLGFTLKSKGYKYKKNVIVGIIMTALLCIYGSFSLIFANVYDHSDDPIIRAEQTIGIDIPKHKQISTQDWTKGTQSVSRGYIYFTSTIYFDNAAVEEFEKHLATDDKWLSSVSNDLIGITSPINDYGLYDYVLIYNVDTSEFNTLPTDNGKFRFINILYQLEDNQMKIVEYDFDYIISS